MQQNRIALNQREIVELGELARVKQAQIDQVAITDRMMGLIVNVIVGRCDVIDGPWDISKDGRFLERK